MTNEELRNDLEHRRSYWVIEFRGYPPRVPGVTNYCCIRDVEDPTKEGFMDWTGDHNEAMQFARKRDAELFILPWAWGDREHIAICEHIDMAPHSGDGC